MSDERYPIPAARHRVEQTIQRSRFIATLAPAATVPEAVAFVKEVSFEHASATHNCWAYLVGAPGRTDRVGLSDDGEPHGTAGRPMLNALLHSGLGDVVAVVTRYYGGVKLGTGGLVRAYGGTLQLALESLETVEKVDYAEVAVVVDYASLASVQALLADYEAAVVDQAFAADVTLRVRAPAPRIDALRAALADATRGRAVVSE
jgi:uncharacterized YigZ family protein